MRGTAQPREQTTRPGLLRLTRLDRWVAESLPWPITIVLSQVLVPALKRRRTNWEPSFLEGTVLNLRTSGGTRYQFRPPHIPAWAVTAVTPSGDQSKFLIIEPDCNRSLIVYSLLLTIVIFSSHTALLATGLVPPYSPAPPLDFYIILTLFCAS